MDRAIYMKFFQISVNTFYLWKKQKRPVVEFFSKYTTDEEIIEFMETGKIQKQDRLEELLEIEKKYNQIVGIIDNKYKQNIQSSCISIVKKKEI